MSKTEAVAEKSVSRIYRVQEITAPNQIIATMLVRAKSQAGAIKHVTTGRFAAEVATKDQLVELLTDGITVQDAANGE